MSDPFTLTLLESGAPVLTSRREGEENAERFQTLGLERKDQLAQLYEIIDGYSAYDSRNDIRLWPLHEIIEASIKGEFSQNSCGIAFSDFLINDQVFLYRKTDNSVYSAYGDDSVAISLAEFLVFLRHGKVPPIT